MKASTAQTILRELARVAEASYRRGFAHGTATAAGHHDLVVDVSAWRRLVPLDRSPSPIGGRPMSAVDRLEHQAPDLVRRLRTLIDK
ncbi:MAG: hypothetical protein ACKO1M_14035 [Planctomycetota bacterium]